MEHYSIILFHSTNSGMWAAKVLKKENIERKMVPIPRHLSSDCGYCIRIKKDVVDTAKKLLEENKIEYDKIVDYDKKPPGTPEEG